MCKCCKLGFGSCEIFQDYYLQISQLNEVFLQSNESSEDITTVSNISNGFLAPNSFCAIAADEKSSETVWFLQIKSTEVANANMVDDYGHTIAAGMEYLLGSYLEKCKETKKGRLFKMMGKDAFFFKETIVLGMLFILSLELISIFSSRTSCFCFINELATVRSLTHYP